MLLSGDGFGAATSVLTRMWARWMVSVRRLWSWLSLAAAALQWLAEGLLSLPLLFMKWVNEGWFGGGVVGLQLINMYLAEFPVMIHHEYRLIGHLTQFHNGLHG